MRIARASRAKVSGFDLTPMIDVVLQLIIFFLFTARFGELVRSDVDLPKKMGDETAVMSDALVIDVTAEGAILVDNTPTTLDRAAELAAGRGASGVRLRCDRGATGATLNRVTRALASAGVDRISVGTSQEGLP